VFDCGCTVRLHPQVLNLREDIKHHAFIGRHVRLVLRRDSLFDPESICLSSPGKRRTYHRLDLRGLCEVLVVVFAFGTLLLAVWYEDH